MVDYVKYLMWLPIVAVPFMVFWARPQSHPAWRIGRLLAAVALLYVALNIVLHLQSRLEWNAINAFRDQNPECWLQPCEGERKPTVDGPNLAGAMFVGWVPALAYVGVWELAWRIRHRKAIRVFEWRDIGIVFSSALIFISILIPLLFYSFVVYTVVSVHGFFSIRTHMVGLSAMLIIIISVLALLTPEPVQGLLIQVGKELMAIIEQQ